MANGGAWDKEEMTVLKVFLENRPIKDIARVLGRSYGSVYVKAKELGFEVKPKPKKEVAVYRGDELLAVGTIRECAEITGLSYQSIACYLAPSFQNRYKNTEILVVELEPYEDEMEGGL